MSHPPHFSQRDKRRTHKPRPYHKPPSRKRKPSPDDPLNTQPFQRVGVIEASPLREGYIVLPTTRERSDKAIICSTPLPTTFHPGDAVVYAQEGQRVVLKKDLGPIRDIRTHPWVALYRYNLPCVFSNPILQECESFSVPDVTGRLDLRSTPFVTIDGDDAKDFDDAVWAEPCILDNGEKGWRLMVSIADVGYYVRPGTLLDQEAYRRGQSIYFPNLVIPMLPEALSNGVCSLQPDQDRACLTMDMTISQEGHIESYAIKRSLIRSHGRLTYTQVQQAIDTGGQQGVHKDLWTKTIQPLYGVYKSLYKARLQRETLEFELPEFNIDILSEDHVSGITLKKRLESHRLIEEAMIAANVSAARLLKKWSTLYRVHDVADSEKIRYIQGLLPKMNRLKKKTLTNKYLNALLKAAKGTPKEQLIHMLLLRSQSQACYDSKNIGHFGLGLKDYCHFTSPIRRYADLIVHRCLMDACQLGPEGYGAPLPLEKLSEIGSHISHTERLSVSAERETLDRMTISFMQDKVGQVFTGMITGITASGLFIRIPEYGAEGYLSKSNLEGDVFIYDSERHSYRGKRTKKIYQLGDTFRVLAVSADCRTRSLSLSLKV